MDYANASCTVNVEGTKLSPKDLVAAFEGTRFTAVVKKDA